MNPETFSDLKVTYVSAMIRSIRNMWKNEQIRLGDQTASMVYYLSRALGYSGYEFDKLNIFRQAELSRVKTSTGGGSAKGPALALSPRAAEGLVQAVELGLLPEKHWIQIAPLWHNISEAASKHRKVLEGK